MATASPLLALSMTDSPVFAGWVAAATALPGLALHLPAGWSADRIDRRQIMRTAQCVRCCTAVLSVLGLLLLRSPWVLVAAVLLDGTCAAFYDVAENAALRHVVPREDRKSAVARNEARIHIAQFLGRPLGGFIFELANWLPYFINAITSFISMRMITELRTGDFHPFRRAAPATVAAASPKAVAPDPIAARNGTARAALELLSREAFLRTSILVCAVANFFFQTVILLLIVMAQDVGISGAIIGFMLAASGVGGLLGSVVAPHALRSLSPQFIVVCCVWSWLLLLSVIAVAGTPIIGLLAWGSCSFMGAHVNVALAAHENAVVPQDILGRVIGISRFVTSGVIPLGALTGGYIIAGLTPQGTALLAAGIMLAMVVTISISGRAEIVNALQEIYWRLDGSVGIDQGEVWELATRSMVSTTREHVPSHYVITRPGRFARAAAAQPRSDESDNTSNAPVPCIAVADHELEAYTGAVNSHLRVPA